MTYNTLERITRQAVCNTLGARSDNFDQWLETYDPDEIIKDEGLDLGTSVELYFVPAISPLKYFSSDVTFYVTIFNNQSLGAVSAFFGSSCCDVDAAEAAVGDFLDRDASDGWYVADEFDEDAGLHLVREFTFDPESESDIESKIASCFNELLENETADKLRPFIHYFED